MTKQRYVNRIASSVIAAFMMVVIGYEYPAAAQSFDAGSDGSDGALSLTEPGTFIFDPREFGPPLDVDADNVFHFTSIDIAAGVEVVLPARTLNSLPVFWLASGTVRIDGTVSLDGEDAYHVNEPLLSLRRPAQPGAGGYPGGIGEYGGSAAQPGLGPGGGGAGLNFFNGHGGSGAGHGANGGGAVAGAAYGNNFLVPLVGGSGGGGGSSDQGFVGGGGGGGGGALLIASSASILIDGVIQARGGASGTGGNAQVGGGGGGSGGAIHLLAPLVNGAGNLDVSGGPGNGAVGRIRVDAVTHDFTGTATGASAFGTLSQLVLPQSQPRLRIVSVAGEVVEPDPTGSFELPDVTIVGASVVTVEIEAMNVPLGTVVKLHLFSENGLNQIVDSTPLAGTEELSTATFDVDIPTGFSRFFARVTFGP